MSTIEKRLDALEKENEQLRLDIHAANYAIMILSASVGSLGNEPDMLARQLKEAIANKDVKFDSDQVRAYHDILMKKVLAILSTDE